MRDFQDDIGQIFLDAFERIYVINLSYRKDRLHDVSGQLARLGLGFDHPQVQRFEASRPKHKGAFPTIGTRGCFESHLAIMKDFLRSSAQRCLILEDDTDFARDFEDRGISEISELTSKQWDIVYGHAPEGMTGNGRGFAVLAPEVPNLRLHFYGLTRKAAELAVPYLEGIYARPSGDPRGGAMHVDGAMNWFRAAHPELKTQVARHALAIQRPSRTDIHDLHWFDRLPLFRQGAAQLRRVKRAI